MRVAVIGATGAVGGTILRVLEERAVPVDTLLAYASRERAEGVRFRDATVPIAVATRERLLADRPDVAFFASSEDASAELASTLVDAGTIVIDNTAAFRLADGVPLVIPEVNPQAIHPSHRLFPVANCTAIVLCVALAPIERAIGLSSVRVASYQAVSGAGRAGLDALADEERGMAPNGTFAAPIFRNVVPQVGSYDGDGDTGEEKKVIAETRKMLGRPDLHVAVTTVREQSMQIYGHVAFTLGGGTQGTGSLSSLFIVTPRDVEDSDIVHVARLRPEPEDESDTHFQMWVVGDQLRKGAATNAAQILELLIAQGRFALV